MDNLKNKLLDLDVFEDNEYLQKYVDLVTLNRDQEYVVHCTQRHHIVPVMYYKYYNKPVDNSADNLVNLYYKDHVLAHYYLYFAFKENIFKYKNFCAVNHILGSNSSEINLLQELDDYQLFYENSRKLAIEYNPMNNPFWKEKHEVIMRSDKVRKRISETMKGVRASKIDEVSVHKGNIEKRVPKSKLDTYLSDGWQYGSKQQGCVYIHNIDNQEKKVSIDQLSTYLDDGWILGGKENRISQYQRKKLDESHYKKVYCIDLSGKEVRRFNSLKEADLWWYNNGYGQTRKKPADYRELSNVIKQSAVADRFIEGLKWIYVNE